ncbi:uncharacterized protein PF3D7_1120600-like [Aedes albopictus]|uniref:Uncharacterized protein n=1 Tax=Aedes albopictus TaxID=7160 RepID=A0ABM1Y1G7_AEDAL
MREESFIEAIDHLKHADKLEPVNALHFPENLENVEENISAPEANRKSESISCDATQEDVDFINKTMATSTENEAGSIQVSDVQPCTDNVHTSLPLEVELVICEDDENIKTPKERENDEENALVIMRDESIMDASDYPEHAEQLDRVIVPQDDLIKDEQPSDTSEKFEWNKASLDNVSDSTGADYDVPIAKHVNDEEIVLIEMPEKGVELESTNHASQSLDKQQQICGDVENDEKTRVDEDEEENALIQMRDESFNMASDHFEHAENVDSVNVLHLQENIVNPSKEAERMGESVPCESVLQTSTENKAGNTQIADIVVVCNDEENLEKIGEGKDDEENSSVMIGDEPIMETLALPEDADILDLVKEDLCKEKQPSDTSDEFEFTKASLDYASDSAGSQHVPTDEMKPNHAENMNENIVLQETERDSEPIACDAEKENTDFTCTVLKDFDTNEESKIYVSDAQPCDEDYDVKIREGVDEEEEALIKMREESFMKTSDHPEHAEKVEPVIVQQEKMDEDKQHRDVSEGSEQSKVLLDNAFYCTDADHDSKDTLINDENLVLRKIQEEELVTNHPESKENLEEKICSQETESKTMLCDAVKDSTDTNTALEILVKNEAGESQVSDVPPCIENVNISQTLEIQLMISDNAENDEKATGGENQEENALIIIRRQNSMEEKLDNLESADHIVQGATLDSNTNVAQYQSQLSEEPQPALTKTTVQIDSENVNDPINLQHIPRVDFIDKDNSSVQDEMSNYSENIENLEKPILSQEDCTLNSIVTMSNVTKNDEIISQCISREDKAIVNNNKPDSFDVYDIKTTTNSLDNSEDDTPEKDKRNFSNENEKNQFHSYWKYRDAELLDALYKISIETDQPIGSIEEELDTFNKNYNDAEERMKSYMYEMRNVSKYFDYNDAEVKHNLLRVSDDTKNIQQYISDSNSDITPKANYSILEAEQSVTNASIDEKNLIIQNTNIAPEIAQDASDLSKDTQNKIQNRIETFVYELNDVIDHWKYADAESMYVAYKSPIVTSLNDADHDEISKQGEPNKQELSTSILSTSVAASIENEKGEHILFDELNNKLNRPSDYDEDAPIKAPESPLNNQATSFIYEAKVYHDYWKYADAETLNMTYRTQPVTSTECVKYKELTKDMPKHESCILDKSDMSDEVTQNENKAEKPSKIEPLYSEVVSGNTKHKSNKLAVEATNFEPDEKCSTLNYDEETSGELAKNQNTNNLSEVQHVDITMENIVPILPKAGLDDPHIISSEDLDQHNIEKLSQCRIEVVKEVPLQTESDEKYDDGKETNFFKSTINEEHDISKETAPIEFVDIDAKATNSSESTNEVNNDICIKINQHDREEKSHHTTENFKITAAQNTPKSAENEYTNDEPKESIISCIEPSALSIGMDGDGPEKAQLLSTPHQLEAFWKDKPLYDDAESTYIKSMENLNKCIVPEQDYPRAVDSIVDEQVPTQLTQTSNNILTQPLLQNPATNSNLSVPPPNPPNTLLGTTSTVNIRNPKETVDDCTIYEQTLSESVENILQSLLNEELKMNNLPYDNMNSLIKGLQVLIEKLSEYKEQNYAISTSLPQNADYKIKESVRLIDERIDFLRQRAQDGLEKIQVNMS